MTEYATRFIEQFLDMALAVSPWLLLGLVAAGLLRVFLPTSLLQRWLGKAGWPWLWRWSYSPLHPI